MKKKIKEPKQLFFFNFKTLNFNFGFCNVYWTRDSFFKFPTKKLKELYDGSNSKDL